MKITIVVFPMSKVDEDDLNMLCAVFAVLRVNPSAWIWSVADSVFLPGSFARLADSAAMTCVGKLDSSINFAGMDNLILPARD